MDWRRIEVDDGENAGQHWERLTIGPFEIDVFPPWADDDTWHVIITASADELVDFPANSEKHAKKNALTWLGINLVRWAEKVKEARETLGDG
ncbi:MAG: hypothetical protein ACOC8X_11695 [Chloroflexota bacterium]